jgi:hypothetical protein
MGDGRTGGGMGGNCLNLGLLDYWDYDDKRVLG